MHCAIPVELFNVGLEQFKIAFDVWLLKKIDMFDVLSALFKVIWKVFAVQGFMVLMLNDFIDGVFAVVRLKV